MRQTRDFFALLENHCTDLDRCFCFGLFLGGAGEPRGFIPHVWEMFHPSGPA